jgi:PilZ domain-containing protein
VDSEIAVGLCASYPTKRRAVRYKLDVPLRIILHQEDKTLVREGRGMELSELGMCVSVGLELKVGGEVEIEFTLPYSSEPIRVSGAVRNRKGYRYGCEFNPDGPGEHKNVERLRRALQTFAAVQPS